MANWAYPRELAEVSFKEHTKLALRHGGRERWGWREVSCGQWEGYARGVRDDADAGASSMSGRDTVRLHRRSLGSGTQGSTLRGRNTALPADLDWIDEALTEAYEVIGGSEETAQVHPYEFTTSMLALAREVGREKLDVVEGARVVSIERGSGRVDVSATTSSNSSVNPCNDDSVGERVERKGDRVVGVTYLTTTDESQSHRVLIPADTVLLAAGPWSPTLMPSLPITSTRVHSIVIEPAASLSPHVLFTNIHSVDGTDADEAFRSPEIYARPHNRAYACGSGDDTPLPHLASLVRPSTAAISSLKKQVDSISTPLRDGRVEVEQACYMPNVQGGPIVGAVDTFQGLIIATGHTCWGICNAPGTAKAVAELMMEGRLGKEWKLGKLKPGRFLKK